MDIASLGIRIDSSQAKVAVSELDKLAVIGATAEKSIIQTAKAGKELAKSMDDGAKAARANSRSIDDYLQKLKTTVATNGMGSRESRLYELAVRGASRAQLEAADSAIRMNDAYLKGVLIGDKLKVGFIAAATAAAGLAAAGVAIGRGAITALADFKDLSEVTGATIENISALDRIARQTGGTFETVSTSLVKFNQALASADGKNDASRVLKAIGLDAKALKDIDPAEALRLTAVALARFADDGTKARAVQELFGKSVKDVGPFLKDLAEQSKLVGTMSAESANQADTFNKQLSSISANAQDAARSIVRDLLPSLNRLLKNFTEIKESGGLGTIFKDAALDIVGLGKLTGNNGADINKFIAERTKLQKDLEFATRKGLATRGIEDDLVNVEKYLSVARIKQRNSILDDLPSDTGDALARRLRPASIVVPDKMIKGKVDRSAIQEASAQLNLDIDKIRRDQDGLYNTISNREKILAADRAANLISEGDYYSEKRALLTANTQVQEIALQLELERLQKEKLTGKERIDNQRKIVDVESRLAKLQENGATELAVLDKQRAAALAEITIKYSQATAAAQSYVDTISRQNDRELSGVGRGTFQREVDSRRNQRDDQLQARREQLDGQLRAKQITPAEFDFYLDLEKTAHGKALAEDERYYRDKLIRQTSYLDGATEAMANYAADAINVAKGTEEVFTNAFKGLEDGWVSFLTTGKLDFKSFANSVISDITRIIVKQQIAAALTGVLGGGGGTSGNNPSAFVGGSSGGGLGGIVSSFFGSLFGARAIGGPVSAGGMYRVNEKGPEVLSVAGKQYLMMGNQGGSVSPSGGSAPAQRPISITYNAAPGETTKTASQNGAALARSLAVAQQRNS